MLIRDKARTPCAARNADRGERGRRRRGRGSSPAVQRVTVSRRRDRLRPGRRIRSSKARSSMVVTKAKMVEPGTGRT